ncbi:MAG: heavy-metal-associated domain-containing protein [Dehalococcoidia bacterium]|nr:heavy-metal-associated domain-containing protein [Dehalococcoidia bacterium]
MTLPGSVNDGFRALRRHGVRVHLGRLADAPRIEAAGARGDSPDVRVLRLRGVVCAVCASRTEAALRSVSGVEVASVDLEGLQATVRFSPGARVDVAALQQAVEGVVLGMGLRRWLERAVSRVRPRAAAHGVIEGAGRSG